MNQIQRDQRNFILLTNEITLMKDAIDGYTRKVSKPHVAAKLIKECRERIFNAALHLGDFITMFEYADTDDQIRTMVRLGIALTTEEAENCECKDDVFFVKNGETNITKFVKFFRMYDQNKVAWTDIYKCTQCGFMTDKTTGAHFEASNRLELARNTAPEKNKKSDSEVL